MSQHRYFLDHENLWQALNDKFGEDGGAYVLKCLSSDESVIPVERILDKDHEGILYIGKADRFAKRVVTLRRSLSPEYNQKHACGVRYKSNLKFVELFPFNRLVVELYPSESPFETEINLLNSYEQKFGELPPFNRVK